MGKRSSREEVRSRTRQKRLLYFTLLLFVILTGRLFDLQLINHSYYNRYSDKNKLHATRVVAPRGEITDINNKILVDNVPHYEIVIPWGKEKETLLSIRKVCVFLDLDTTEVFSRFEAWKKRNRGMPFPVVPDADKIIISIVRENSDLYPNLWVQTSSKRRYRYGTLAAHLLGHVGEVGDAELSKGRGDSHKYKSGDMVGKMGIELIYEKQLRGKNGQRVEEVIASGTKLGEVEEHSTPPIPGKRLQLTIDSDLQHHMEQLLAEWSAGAVVVMDVWDGSILTAVSTPTFDPNSFTTGIDEKEWRRLSDKKTKPMFNRFLKAAYPPGSTLKMVSAYAALKNHIVPSKKVLTYCTGSYRYGNRIHKCWKAAGHGYVDMYKGVVESCDSYFFKVAESMDVDELAAASRAFGLGVRTGIDLTGETRGLVPDRAFYNKRFGRRKWTQGQVLNNIIGQGEYLASVLHMCRVAAAVANGGDLVQPHVIHSIEREPDRRHPKKRIPNLSSNILSLLRKTMRDVVRSKNGTAHGSRVESISFTGKTGTAQNPHGEDHAWFIGYAPVDNPEIAISIIVENSGHGGTIAAPIARDFFLRFFLGDSTTVIAEDTGKQTSEASETSEGGQ